VGRTMTTFMTTRRSSPASLASLASIASIAPLRALAAAFALAALTLWSLPSRADIPPSCDSESSLVTCAATEVGQPCHGGGTCFEMTCGSSAGPLSKVYKCDTCPTIIAAPSGTCTFDNMGSTCGDGDGGTGTCAALRYYCNSTPDKFVCVAPPAAATTDGGATDKSTASSSGCDVAPRPPKPTTIGLGLVAVGLAAFCIDRARRRAR
jgi:hypothetical protein